MENKLAASLKSWSLILIWIFYSLLPYSYFSENNLQNYAFSTTVVVDDLYFLPFDYILNYLELFIFHGLFLAFGYFAASSYQGKSWLKNTLQNNGFYYLLAITLIAPLAFYPGFLISGHLGNFTDFWMFEYFQNYWNPAIAVFLLQILLCDVAFHYLHRFKKWQALSSNITENPYATLWFIAIIYTVSHYLWPHMGAKSWMTLWGPVWFQPANILSYIAIYLVGAVWGENVGNFKFTNFEKNLKTWYNWPIVSLGSFALLAIFTESFHSEINNFNQNNFLTFIFAFLSFWCMITSLMYFASSCYHFSNYHWQEWMSENFLMIFLASFVSIIYLQYVFYSLELSAVSKGVWVFVVNFMIYMSIYKVSTAFLVLKKAQIK